MRKLLVTVGGILLLLPMAWGQDEAKKNSAKEIIAEYAAGQKAYLDAARAAKTAEERTEARKLFPDAAKFAGRLMEVAKADPKSTNAGDAVVWVSTVASRTPEAKAAIEILIAHHAAHPNLPATALDRLSFNPHPQIGKFLAKVATDNPNADTKKAATEIGKYTVGQVVPDIKGEDTDGKPFKLSDYRGKVVLLDFWGHW